MSAAGGIEPSGSIKFDNQTYLVSYFPEIADKISKEETQSDFRPYSLNNTPDLPLPELLAIFNNKSNISPFVNLSTHQYSALIPRIRLFRVEYNNAGKQIKEKEFIFKKDYEYQITNLFDPIKRNNCGIKRFNWRLNGTNPITADKQVEVEIEFYFDSINSFSSGDFDTMREKWIENGENDYQSNIFDGFTDTDTTTKNYWSLLFHPKNIKNKEYETFNYRIKANVGWENIDPNIVNQLFTDIDINTELKKLNYTFMLNLIEHKFNFNEDGSLGLTATYIASFENATHTEKFNILGPLKEQLESIKNRRLGSVYGDVLLSTNSVSTGAELPDELKDVSLKDVELINSIINSKTNLECVTDVVGSLGALRISSTSYQEVDEEKVKETLSNNLTELTDTVNKIINEAQSIAKSKYYKLIINKIISTGPIYRVTVTKQKKDNWERGIKSGVLPDLGEVRIITPDLSSTGVTPLIQDELKTEESTKSLETTLRESGLQGDEDFNEEGSEINRYITFVSLGTIVKCAYDIIAERYSSDTRYSRYLEELKRQRIIAGNISDEAEILNIAESESTGPKVNRNLFHVPIDLKLFKLFMIENVVKPQKDTFSLFGFIKQVVTSLAVGALNGSNYFNNLTNKYSDTSLATTVFILGDAKTGKDPMQELLKGDLLNLKNNIQKYYVDNINQHNEYYNYFLIYDKAFKDFYPKQIREEDEKMGIYHYTVGEDVGILKSANFSRIDTPYLKEAKAVGRKTVFLGQFRDIYNVSLNMVGNNIYTPGMVLYIQPSAEASFTVTSDPENAPSFSQITGIGGYYFVNEVESTISEEMYETKLDCIWQADGSETKPDASLEKQQRCQQIFSNINPQSARLLSQLILKSQNQVAEE
jgi:hypothetical protein